MPAAHDNTWVQSVNRIIGHLKQKAWAVGIKSRVKGCKPYEYALETISTGAKRGEWIQHVMIEIVDIWRFRRYGSSGLCG